MPERFSPGQAIDLVEVSRGRAWEERPAIVVCDQADLIALFTPPNRPARAAVNADGLRVRLPLGDWTLEPVRTFEFPVLGLHVPGTAHSVLLVWETDWSMRHWYINLESDLVRTDRGFECEDHVLDVVVVPDKKSWRWKDEDELQVALEHGLFTLEQAAELRAEGERAIEWLLAGRRPYDRDWPAWRPPSDWS